MHEGLALRPGVSLCEASGRLIFLDLHADRYFALEAAPEAAVRALLAGQPERADRDQLDRLLAGGLLHVARENEGLRPCPAISQPSTSLLDQMLPKVSIAPLLGAARDLLHARLRLAARGIAAVLDHVSAAKARHASRPADDGQLARVAAAFDASARLTRSHDQCLARSAAAATRLAMLGVGVDLVIGVRVRPFAAHCWIQTNAWLVNDRHDTVRAYTPILVI